MQEVQLKCGVCKGSGEVTLKVCEDCGIKSNQTTIGENTAGKSQCQECYFKDWTQKDKESL